ncbi:PAS domain S-box-containing protein/diguanylate cyclase (GGDEF) domain-containing protein [Marinospirillum celere]|uniref:PAS domain S-box-containing protein/diguanylate cyclase (GGDEF) domain-containing protein n=1 Tax=Marinospirillum celere TaxID=1122252 RepID=A0A1I1I1H6_9GAMM|nr:GGDEF domain-containing phosphodiesterase [Marinospirillum celere]SFC30147.1 PAS domain S-box-containing protein/diguanylate cyclase (GGDEF) domain-containing protein [Marinospirillum celere]
MSMERLPTEQRHDDPVKSPLLVALANKLRHALVITDADRRILYVNPAYQKLTGIDKKQALGQITDLNPSGRHHPDFYSKVWKELEVKGVWEGEIWAYRAEGTAYLQHLSLEAIKDAKGNIENFFALFSDLTEQDSSAAELEHLTHYDPLTDLPNRLLFRNRLGHEFNISNRHNSRTGLVLLNLDRFKLINDAFGYAAGDCLLIEIAHRLQGAIRCTDLLARQEQRQERDADLLSRMGGDDFSFILSELRKPDDAGIVAERLLSCFETPFYIEGEEVYISASLGLAVYPDNADNEDALLQCAESALKQVKRDGKGGYRFFSEDLNISSARRVRMETRMRNAIANQEFVLYYQPKQDLTTGWITGMEALIRWPSDEGMITPGEFIPLAEDTGLINPLGRWILFQALQDTQIASKAVGYPLQVAVNLSMRQFQRPGLGSLIQEAIQATGIQPEQVELEITESMVAEEVEKAINTMQELRSLGVRLAIDDFGTGYSSMAYLRNFPVNTLKIDQSFVQDLVKDDSNTAIISAVIGLGKGLGMQVVAEGVETALQRKLLEEAGCHVGQGYHFSYPLPLPQLIGLLKDAQNAASNT